MAFLWCFFCRFGIFGFSHCWAFSWIFGRCFLLVESFMYNLLQFSAPGRLVRVLDQQFSPTVSTALMMGWTGWKFVAAIAFVASCYC